MPVCPPLSGNVTADVCVVGAGIAGLTTAYMLTRQGLSVAIVDAQGIGAGETGRTTAHIAGADEGYRQIERMYGGSAARLVAASFESARDLIETTVTSESIDCDFERVDGYLFSCEEDPHNALELEWLAATRARVPVMWAPKLPIGTHAVRPCLHFPRQAQFHPLRYLAGLADVVVRRRGAMFCGTQVLDVKEREGGVLVTTATGRVSAEAAVVATNTPFNQRVAIHIKQFAYQSYVIAAQVDKDALPHVLIWDDCDPYHYVRLAPAPDGSHDLLIVGGADHKTGQEREPAKRYDELESWLRQHYPQAGAIAFRWSGEVMEPLDGLAYLGRIPGANNIYVITGDSGDGISHGTIGAMLVSDQIVGRQNPWVRVYDPSRKPYRQTLRFIREQANIAAQYADWVSPGDEAIATTLAPGEGAVVRAGLKKVAVYCDDDGAMRCHSAVCPHLGCIVHWNAAENTWDCPCHGSRFNAYGSVLHGPATSGLAALDEADTAQVLRVVSGAGRMPEERRPKS